jgi:hypothetical protein
VDGRRVVGRAGGDGLPAFEKEGRWRQKGSHRRCGGADDGVEEEHCMKTKKLREDEDEDEEKGHAIGGARSHNRVMLSAWRMTNGLCHAIRVTTLVVFIFFYQKSGSARFAFTKEELFARY